MAFAPVTRMHIKNAVERILHVQGNYNGGPLEMAIIFDCNISEEYIKQLGKELAALLKTHSEIFRNVRLHTICWEGDVKLIKETASIPHLLMGRGFENYRCGEQKKRLELLAEQLKKFYARSKLIILITDGNYYVADEQLFKDSMHPFLHRKLMAILCEEKGMQKDGAEKALSVLPGRDLLKK